MIYGAFLNSYIEVFPHYSYIYIMTYEPIHIVECLNIEFVEIEHKMFDLWHGM